MNPRTDCLCVMLSQVFCKNGGSWKETCTEGFKLMYYYNKQVLCCLSKIFSDVCPSLSGSALWAKYIEASTLYTCKTTTSVLCIFFRFVP